MKRLIVIIVFFQVCYCLAQRRLTNEDIRTWTQLKKIQADTTTIVSGDGKYFIYKYGNPLGIDNFVIQEVDGKFKSNLDNVLDIMFTPDSRYVVCSMKGDSLGIINLHTHDEMYIADVRSVKLAKAVSKLLWLSSRKDSRMSVFNFANGKTSVFPNVRSFITDAKGSSAIVKSACSVSWIDLKEMKSEVIVKDCDISQVAFDSKGTQALVTTGKQGKSKIFRYQKKTSVVTLILSDSLIRLEYKFLNILNYGQLRFTSDGNKVLFEMSGCRSKPNVIPKPLIWNYKDSYIRREYDHEPTSIGLTSGNGKITIICDETHNLIYGRENYAIRYTRVNQDEYYWNSEKSTLNLVSLKDGKSRLITVFPKSIHGPIMQISPSERYVVWFDDGEKHYKVYNIASGSVVNISKSIPNKLFYEGDKPSDNTAFGIAGWLADDERILIYDKYDIWAIDPQGVSRPKNLTKEIGSRSNVIFRLVPYSSEDIALANDLYVSAFNEDTKGNALWEFSAKKAFNPDLSLLKPYVYSIIGNNGQVSFTDVPQKVGKSGHFLVRRMSSSESPNIFITHDFKKYDRLTDFQPEKKCIWMNTELFNWTLPNGKNSQGILYKPNNFDVNKKYPVIFAYYEKRSNELNVYRQPDYSYGDLNIAWYVSNGYLVFIPDIHYETGNVLQSVVNSVVSAAENLKKLPGVDSTKMGLQGHSFGGYETLCIITQTNLFKAAQESAGPSEVVSAYSHLFTDVTRQAFYEFNQQNLGASYWDKPITFVKNSPLTYVKNVQTPILILHNRYDLPVSQTQGIQFYAALRRLQKPTWLISYENEGHSIEDMQNSIDFTIRQQQFFGHYLKDEPMPDWMKGPTTE